MGLPAGTAADITLMGPAGDAGPAVERPSGSQTLSVVAGPWTATTGRVIVDDPLVRTVYRASVTPETFCLGAGGNVTVTVRWERVPTSNSIWAINENAMGQLVGFRSEQLRGSGRVDMGSGAAMEGPFGKDVAFDQDGNLWTVGPTSGDAMLNRFPAFAFERSARVRPDRRLNIRGESCLPAALAFDFDGNLYVVSLCGNRVLRIDRSQLEGGSEGVVEVAPSLSLSVPGPKGIAFDRAGNLWVASESEERVWRFDAGQLASGAVAEPALELGIRETPNPDDRSLFKPSWVAFDARGDLWGLDFGANAFFRVSASELGATGVRDVQPEVRIFLGVSTLPGRFAFDGQGGIWVAGSERTILRLGPGQLSTSSSTGAPTMPELVIRSSDIGYAGSVAFYPAPRGLPLYHALP
jgi:sugar lactone lactonase YvrE